MPLPVTPARRIKRAVCSRPIVIPSRRRACHILRMDVHAVIRGVYLADVLYQGGVTKTTGTHATGFVLAVSTRAEKTTNTMGV